MVLTMATAAQPWPAAALRSIKVVAVLLASTVGTPCGLVRAT